MKWLYAIAYITNGRVVAGIEFASDRDNAFRDAETHIQQLGDLAPDTRISALQLPWDALFNKIEEAMPNDPSVVMAVDLLRKKFPDGRSQSEPRNIRNL